MEKHQNDENEVVDIAAAIAAHAPSCDPNVKGEIKSKKVSFAVGDDTLYKAADLAVHKILKRDGKSQE